MCLCQRRLEIVQLRIGVVTQVADRGLAVTRQHIERIGDLVALILDVDVIGQRVLQVFQRLLNGLIRHDKTLLACPRQKFRHVRIEPEVTAPGPQRPKLPAEDW